eukprot:gnl/MRDRNA2_/MRDRNA2_80683_c0_seq1.p1 gnl/MRDRNA2_/MRDRNA2_80683_c0~~gnl/MRDRNA2_/MRDRNA2_80683_c0_seq1.p1  ORF type:complete len:180 (-),score=21.31 gnl/MRDRNA2_/MRDRNA2_80683_c0_seq1:275-790(-)
MAHEIADIFESQREHVDDFAWLDCHMVQCAVEAEVERCPITLEPLTSLERRPFGLKSTSAGEASRGIWLDEEHGLAQNLREAVHWFDGAALALFLASGCQDRLRDPVNRRPLERGECESLDLYLKEHGIVLVSDAGSSTSVTAVYDALHQRTVIWGWAGMQNLFRAAVEGW